MRRLSLLLVALPLALASSAAAAGLASDPRVSAAVVAAVQQRVGAGADVIVDALEIFIPDGTPAVARIAALADPAGRLGAVVHFALTVDGVRAGHAEARVRVFADRARATRLLTRGAMIAAGDVEDVREEIADGPLRPGARAAELTGGRVLRDLAAGQIVPVTAVLAQPAVRSGQTVTAISRVDGIEASATLVAAESGNPGAVIRVVNRATRKALRARVVSTEIVEIIHD